MCTIGKKVEGVGYIIPQRKTRVDEGDIFQTKSGHDAELLYMCPHAVMFVDGPRCEYKKQFDEYAEIRLRWSIEAPLPRPMIPGIDCPGCDICYKIREVRYVDTIKIARLIGKDFVAIDDIVDVKVGFISGGGLWDQLGKRNNFAARVVEFGSTDITLDISAEFCSRQVEVPYGKIEKIKRRTEPECL